MLLAMRMLLRVTTEMVFYPVLVILALMALIIVADIRAFDAAMAPLAAPALYLGAPLSLIMSQLALFVLGDARYKWYVAIASLEMALLIVRLLVVHFLMGDMGPYHP